MPRGAQGLLGELLVIAAAPDSAAAIEAWHVDVNARYDFSAHARRFEVKTTTAAIREHHFNSRQLPPLHGLDVWVASVHWAEVAAGASASSIFAELAVGLRLGLSRKLADVIIETIGMPPVAVTSPTIDLQTSIAGIRVFPASAMPTPSAVAGSSDIRWTAYLDEPNGRLSVHLASILHPSMSSEAEIQGLTVSDSHATTAMSS
jgi:hypothetical protein